MSTVISSFNSQGKWGLDKLNNLPTKTYEEEVGLIPARQPGPRIPSCLWLNVSFVLDSFGKFNISILFISLYMFSRYI